MAFAKKLSDYQPELKDQGMDYLAAAGAAGVAIQSGTFTSDGTPDTVTLGKEMANATYTILLQGETVARVTVDESETSATTFVVLGAANTEVVHWLVVGQLKGQVA